MYFNLATCDYLWSTYGKQDILKVIKPLIFLLLFWRYHSSSDTHIQTLLQHTHQSFQFHTTSLRVFLSSATITKSHQQNHPPSTMQLQLAQLLLALPALTAAVAVPAPVNATDIEGMAIPSSHPPHLNTTLLPISQTHTKK